MTVCKCIRDLFITMSADSGTSKNNCGFSQCRPLTRSIRIHLVFELRVLTLVGCVGCPYLYDFIEAHTHTCAHLSTHFCATFHLCFCNFYMFFAFYFYCLHYNNFSFHFSTIFMPFMSNMRVCVCVPC